MGIEFALVGDNLAHRAVLAFKAHDLFAGVYVHLVRGAVVGGHLGHGVRKDAGQDLIHHFHHAALDAPHVGQRNGGLKADKPAAHNDGLGDLAFFAGAADGSGGFKAGERKDVPEVFAFNRGHAGAGAGGQHQLVIGQFFFLPGDHVFDGKGFGRAVNGRGARLRADGDALHVTEKLRVTHGMVGRGAQVVQVLDFA